MRMKKLSFIDYIANLQCGSNKMQIFRAIHDEVVTLSYEMAGFGDILG